MSESLSTLKSHSWLGSPRLRAKKVLSLSMLLASRGLTDPPAGPSLKLGATASDSFCSGMALFGSLLEMWVFSMLLRRFAMVASCCLMSSSSLSLPEVEVVSNLLIEEVL